ncbi:MAG: imidazole glycerol phosphate synthase subunit HisF [Myxococcota bacterium]|nr:imidazole glycerol phosphate synthase subunit HisF [Myxococcota bacterium]
MLAHRVIACLDVKGGRVVKGINFEGLRDCGDPAELAARYEAEGADELVFLDVSATTEARATLWDAVTRTAERLRIPLTVGGGVRTPDDAAKALRAGADKVAVNSAAVSNPELLNACAERFGAQCVVLSIDAKREGPSFRVFTHGGRTRTGLDAVSWAKEAVARGAGELVITSIDRDGVRGGYDLGLTRAISEAVSVPVVASGGAGSAVHLEEAFTEGRAAAALVAGILHDGTTTVRALKGYLAGRGLRIRTDAAGGGSR